MRTRKETPVEFMEANWEEVKFLNDSRSFLDYKVKDHVVILFKDGRKPSCTCSHGSFYGVNKEFEYCYHIGLVKYAIKKRKSFTWDNEKL